MATDGDIPLIAKMVAARGGKEMPADIANADPATARYGGKSFSITINEKKYAVAATKNGACSVLGQGFKAPELRKVLVENYPLLPPEEDSSSAQNITLWRVKAPSRYQGGAIMLNAAKLGFGVDGAVSVGFLPAKLMK